MKDYLKPLYIINPLLYKHSKCYVWGSDKAASQLFINLIILSIKVDGFICDEYSGTTLWNKPVVAYEDIREVDTVICIPDKESLDGISIENYVLSNNLYIMNPECDRKQAVIYGAGKVGTYVLNLLRGEGIEPICFIDSNKNMVGGRIEDILIRDASYLSELSEKVYIIEAGKYYKEIDEMVEGYIGSNKRFYYNEILKLRAGFKTIPIDPPYITLSIDDVKRLEEFFSGRTLYLYGKRELVGKYQKLLKLLNFPVYEVKDVTDYVDEKCVEDLLYEENFLVLLVGEDVRRLVQKMRNLGFQEGKEYSWVENVGISYNFSRDQMLDMHLGYTFIMDENYLGFKVLGRSDSSHYKIVVLGGSTTDDQAYPSIPTWVDCLYSKCKNNVTIFNGGIEGYTSTMELVKMLRDVLKLDPDMVIIYDGVNDAISASNDKVNPFEFTYLRRFLSFAQAKQSENIILNDGYQNSNKVWSKVWGRKADKNYCNIYAGSSEDRDAFDIWVNNMELMYVLSKSKGIKFFGFLQPMLLSKKHEKLTLREKSWINSELIYRNEKSQEMQMNFRKYMIQRKITQTHNYIYDLSSIFDTEDVYMDSCHVYERGNEIIANEIWKIVKSVITES